MTEHVCTCARIDGYRITRADCPIHPMPPRRPAHENPLRLTFTREELDEALAAARAEVVRGMARRLDDLVEGRVMHQGGWYGERSHEQLKTSLRSLVRALLADGGEPQ